MATFQRFATDDVVITTDKAFTSTWSANTNNLITAHSKIILFLYPIKLFVTCS